MTVGQYYQYIESLAASHTAIGHSDSEKHFFRGELEEFYMDLRNRVKFPALIAESFEISFNGDVKTRETSFIVACNYPESKNWQSIYGAMNLCEQIGDEVLRRMMTDASSGEICAELEVLSAVPVLDEQHLYAGMRYTIQISCEFDWDVDEQVWSDLQ